MGGAGARNDGDDRSRVRPLPFSCHGYSGEISSVLDLTSFCAELPRLLDPAAATETIHWGRNYLYATRLGELEVVVKQFRNQGLRRRLDRRLRGSKAARSWTVAWALLDAGIATPEPLALIESDEPEGPSFYLCRRLHGAAEVRHFFRRLTRDPRAGEFPEIAPEQLLSELGRLARQLHDSGICFRDLSIGNVLARLSGDGTLELSVVDINRARLGRRLGVLGRSRDICRFPIVERRHREWFLAGYWGVVPPRTNPRWWCYTASVRGYLLKHAVKDRLRGSGHRRRISTGGTHHAHIPAASQDASARDRIVWDRLSDQPHQHTRGLGKALIRLADAGSHLRDYAIVLSRLPGVWRRYRQLQASLYETPVRFTGIGVCLRPWPDHLDAQIAAVRDLGITEVLLRLHPWEQEHDDEEELARRLHESGCRLSFVLPQNRDLVRDQQRWCAAVRELAERFTSYGRHFQVGQAVNRSKWGIWTRDEYLQLYLAAAAILRENPGVEVLGPAVIDFEHQVTMALVNRRLPGLFFDVVSSLLYVDRRGAPENRQLGFDTVGKVVLLRAIAERGRSCSERCWITEVNWPLWEGPHSPAGRKVSVDEESQADFLARYYLLVLATGLVEKVFWWRLIARGYGLMTFDPDGSLRRRPAYDALKTLRSQLDGALFLGPLPAPAGSYLYRFRCDDGETVAAWSVAPGVTAELPRPATSVVGRDGALLPVPDGATIELSPSPHYYHLSNGSAHQEP